jgi:hypothetical protein
MRKMKVALKARQTVEVKSSPLGGARVGLFIWEVKRLITMPLTIYPINRVQIQGGNPAYYIKTPLYNASNKTLTCACGDAVAFR